MKSSRFTQHLFPLFFLLPVAFFSCSDDDSASEPAPTPVISKVSVFENGVLDYSETYEYNSDRELSKINAADGTTYTMHYSSNLVDSVTLEFNDGSNDARYYFTYSNDGERLTTISPSNPNGNVYFAEFNYDASNRMTLACRYTTQSAFDAGNCSVQFEFFYDGNEKDLAATEFKTDDGNTVNVLNREEFDLYGTSYDFYFGEAFEKLKQPYTPFNPIPNKAILYSQSNVENQYRILNSEKLLLRDYTYTANESGAVTNYTINTYNTSTGELINTEEIVLEYN